MILAARFYGNARLWKVIYNQPENRRLIGNTPDTIRPGWHLIIPPKPP